MTPAALSDDVANDAAQRWFTAAELKSLNASQSVDFFFMSELYVMQEIINAVCFAAVCFTLLNWHCKGLSACIKSCCCNSEKFSGDLAYTFVSTECKTVYGLWMCVCV